MPELNNFRDAESYYATLALNAPTGLATAAALTAI